MNHLKTELNLIQRALQHDTLENFVDALNLSHLFDLIKCGGPFTVFAPMNAAFLNMPQNVFSAIDAENDLLGTILQYHVVAGTYDSSQLLQKKRFRALIGEELFAAGFKEDLYINQARVVHSDIQATNGIIHVIDRILVPINLNLNSDKSAEENSFEFRQPR